MFLNEFLRANKDAFSAVYRKRIYFKHLNFRTLISFYLVRCVTPWWEYSRSIASWLINATDFQRKCANFSDSVPLDLIQIKKIKEIAQKIITDENELISIQKQNGRKKIIFSSNCLPEIWAILDPSVKKSIGYDQKIGKISVDALCWINLSTNENWENTQQSNSDGLFWHRDLDFPCGIKVFLELNLSTLEIKNNVQYVNEKRGPVFSGYKRVSTIADGIISQTGTKNSVLIVDTFQPHRGVRLKNDRLIMQFQLRPENSWNWVGQNSVGYL
jgi:hypothetical protein